MLRPLVLLAIWAASNNQYTPSFPGGIVAWVVCNQRKRNEYGGWLLFFYWQLYSGMVMTAVFFWINFQSYVPENFDDPSRFHLFLVSSVPSIVLFALQTAVATIMISVRTWDLVRLLRGLLVAQVVAACVAVLIDAKYFPDNVALGIMLTLVPESLWMGYFFGSKRVRHVFQTHDWDKAVEAIHPTGSTKIVI
jgi:hypothetical protein